MNDISRFKVILQLKFNLLIFSLIFLPFNKAFPQTSHQLDAKSITAKQFNPIDLIYQSIDKKSDNPFNVSFGAVFVSPLQQEITVPGFYNGNDEFIIRFSANEPGRWTYKTFSSNPDMAGITGTIDVSSNNNENIHGAVTIHPEQPQRFIYEDGTPHFALSFELDWLFALDYGNSAGIPKTAQIVNDVASNGFNQVVMNVYAYDVNWKIDSNVPQEYLYKPNYSVFKGDNQNPDFSELNINFFKHFDRVINHLHERGVVAHIMIYVWNKNVKWPEMYTPEDNRYFDYIIKRYQAFPNIIWDVSKEALDYGRCDINYINERINRIRKLDAFKRLITVHDYEYCSREPDKVDFISIQNWRSDLYSFSVEAALKHPDKPVMNIEHGCYEEGPYVSFQGNYVNAETCLIRTYENIFAGLYSSYYWQDAAWNIVVHDAFDQKNGFERPNYVYYKYMQDLFTRYDFSTLLAAKQKLTTNSRIGADNLSSSAYPLSDGQGLYLYLIPAENHQINTILPKEGSGQIKVTWFNPFTGEYQDGGMVQYSNWAPFQSPWKNKLTVLILELL